MNGIPEGAMSTDFAPSPTASSGSYGNGNTLEQFRHHPQFNQLKRLIQSNPATLPQVLEAIGQQNPDLLTVIHANQEQFLQMMNEPVVDTPTPASTAPSAGAGGAGAAGGVNPLQLLQMIQALPEQQRAAAATSMGISPEQLQMFTQMLSTMSPAQIQQLTAGMGGMGGMGGGAGGMGGAPPGQNVIRLTNEEMESVTRLTELGFDQQDAIAAYLACDKNESVAANLLLEGWSAGDGMGDDMAGGGFDDGQDDMYS
jgi:UV excision repair protein RAD23